MFHWSSKFKILKSPNYQCIQCRHFLIVWCHLFPLCLENIENHCAIASYVLDIFWSWQMLTVFPWPFIWVGHWRFMTMGVKRQMESCWWMKLLFPGFLFFRWNSTCSQSDFELKDYQIILSKLYQRTPIGWNHRLI